MKIPALAAPLLFLPRSARRPSGISHHRSLFAVGLATLAFSAFSPLAFAQPNYATPFSVTTLAGLPGISGSANGTATAARFTNLTGLVVDATGNLYAADVYNNSDRKSTRLNSSH